MEFLWRVEKKHADGKDGTKDRFELWPFVWFADFYVIGARGVFAAQQRSWPAKRPFYNARWRSTARIAARQSYALNTSCCWAREQLNLFNLL